MAGTTLGGKRASEVNKQKNHIFIDGKMVTFKKGMMYSIIGAIGGKNGTTGGFYANRELARTAGAKGGRISRRTKRTA